MDNHGCPWMWTMDMQLCCWWTLYGGASAGTFLAYHYPSLGPYFGNIDAQNWPHSPLRNMPSKLESGFNLQMTKMTEIISNGLLKNVSIMDFPAFGSKFAQLRLKHKIAPNWQTELNFAIFQGNHDSSSLFQIYKTLILDWKSYMEKIALGDPKANFTLTIKNNNLFKFTDHIKDDMTAFLIATHGSFLTTDKQPTSVWTKVAKAIFNETTHTSEMLEKNMYNQLIMKCAFKESLDREKKIHMDGPCEGFYPTLTTNGFCYSFGGPKITINTLYKVVYCKIIDYHHHNSLPVMRAYSIEFCHRVGGDGAVSVSFARRTYDVVNPIWLLLKYVRPSTRRGGRSTDAMEH